MPSVPGPPEAAGPFSAVAVVGLGAMGGSLARALAETGHPPVGWSPDADERLAAVQAGAVRGAPATLAEAVGGADLVILAAPLEAVCRLTEELAQRSEPGAVLSDVASLKAPVLEVARRTGVASRWVGCHPMAGTEASGFSASRADLYHDARVWLVADTAADAMVDRLAAFWERLGTRPARLDAEAHDRLMALVSHLPQLASNALASVLADAGVAPSELGPGGREATRLAASQPGIWRDILAHAPPELAGSLRALSVEAEALARLLDAGEIDALEKRMIRTRAWRGET